jgi:hypothetical protein
MMGFRYYRNPIMKNLELMQLTPSERGELWERLFDHFDRFSHK